MRDIALPYDAPSACASPAEAADLLCVALLYASDSTTPDIAAWLNTRTGTPVIFVGLPHAEFALSVAAARQAAATLAARDCRLRASAALVRACDEADRLAKAFQMRGAH